jgi:hypothetical protein
MVVAWTTPDAEQLNEPEIQRVYAAGYRIEYRMSAPERPPMGALSQNLEVRAMQGDQQVAFGRYDVYPERQMVMGVDIQTVAAHRRNGLAKAIYTFVRLRLYPDFEWHSSEWLSEDGKRLYADPARRW